MFMNILWYNYLSLVIHERIQFIYHAKNMKIIKTKLHP